MVDWEKPADHLLAWWSPAFLPIKRFQVKITAGVTVLWSTTALLECSKSPRSSLCCANTLCCFDCTSCAGVMAPFRGISWGVQLGWMYSGGKKGRSFQTSNYVFLTITFCFDLPDIGRTWRGGLYARPKSAWMKTRTKRFIFTNSVRVEEYLPEQQIHLSGAQGSTAAIRQ